MSAGFVAGAAAVVRDWLRRERGVVAPSAALVKALLVNGARDLLDDAPSCGGGFGRLDVSEALGLRGRVELEDEGLALVEGASRCVSIDVVRGEVLSVTLVWTDVPGPSLVHDLDLIVELDGDELHGNRAIGDAGFDRTNNVERVRTRVEASGQARILVRAVRTGQRGQTFALVRSVAPPT